jgi:hypothetical protein
MLVKDYIYSYVPREAQKAFRKIAYESDRQSVAFMNTNFTIDELNSMRDEAIELSQPVSNTRHFLTRFSTVL